MVATVRKSKKVITLVQLREAVSALSERNGSSAQSIFNYLVWERQANSEAWKQAIWAMKEAVKAGVLVRKNGRGFLVPKNQFASKPARERRMGTVKKSSKIAATPASRGGVKKLRKSKARRWSKVRKSPRKVQTFPTSPAREPVKLRQRKVNDKPKSASNVKPVTRLSSAVPQKRKCTVGIRY